jgi:hypothetical protein
MDAWELMFNNRYVTFAFDEDRKNDFFLDWDAHSDGGTVSSVGLGDRSHLMLEYAIFGDKNTVYVTPSFHAQVPPSPDFLLFLL